MLNLLMYTDGNFAHHLRKLQLGDVTTNSSTLLESPQFSEWLDYWNDADSVAGNLRKFEHWLQRARHQARS